MSEHRVPYTGATEKLEQPVPYHIAVIESSATPEQARDLLAEACADYLHQIRMLESEIDGLKNQREQHLREIMELRDDAQDAHRLLDKAGIIGTHDHLVGGRVDLLCHQLEKTRAAIARAEGRA